jgi:hypothetical protein
MLRAEDDHAAFRLMNEQELGPVAGLLQRARLHLRGGKRRLRQGKISAGIVTLYDALEGAMLSTPNRLRQGAASVPAGGRYDSAPCTPCLSGPGA